MADFTGTDGNDTLIGTAADDMFDMTQGGRDFVSGGDGNDRTYFGATLNSHDRVLGGRGFDWLYLTGDYTQGVTLNGQVMKDIDQVVLGAGFDYKLRLGDTAQLFHGRHDARALQIDTTQLADGDMLTLNGKGIHHARLSVYGSTSAQYYVIGGDANDSLNGGMHDDRLKGGAGDDYIYGGGTGGTDMFRGGAGDDVIYSGSSDVTMVKTMYGGSGDDLLWAFRGKDVFVGGDGADRFAFRDNTTSVAGRDFGTLDIIRDFTSEDAVAFVHSAITGIDTAVSHSLSRDSFIPDLQAIGANLHAKHALEFTAESGDLKGKTFLLVDWDGVAGFSLGDQVIRLGEGSATVTVDNFVRTHHI
jgi:Ca2+-binding RTX toxin-like protein